MEDEVFLDKPYHVNKFKHTFDLEDEENSYLLDDLLISFDGSILGVKSAMIAPFLKEPGVENIRLGLDPMPTKFEIKNEEDFFRTLAILTPISETF